VAFDVIQMMVLMMSRQVGMMIMVEVVIISMMN